MITSTKMAPKDLNIAETKNTPNVFFNSEINEWIISGRSYPNDADMFYEPILDWVSVFENDPTHSCSFIFKLEFLNTNSSKVLLNLLVKLNHIHKISGGRLTIKWYYEEGDDDMKETGESLMMLAKVPFELIGF